MKLLKQFIQQETVLTAAAVLAVVSAFFVLPDAQYLGYIDLLIRLVNDRRQQFYLSNMKSSAQHLLALVTSLLDYHRPQ